MAKAIQFTSSHPGTLNPICDRSQWVLLQNLFPSKNKKKISVKEWLFTALLPPDFLCMMFSFTQTNCQHFWAWYPASSIVWDAHRGKHTIIMKDSVLSHGRHLAEGIRKQSQLETTAEHLQTLTKPAKREKSQRVSVILALLYHESHDLGRSVPQFTRINSRRE